MSNLFARLIGVCVFFFGVNALAGDLVCYGYTSTTSHFECGDHGNCTWWAAYKRPDIASAITGSGWNGGQWSDKLRNLSFMVGAEPEDGAIAEFEGHVAYVEKAHADGSFDVSEMDWYKSQGFEDGINHATYYPGSGNTYHRNTDLGSDVKGSWTLKGFIYQKDPATIPGNQFTVRKVGNYAWYPFDTSCIKAQAWYGLDSNRQIVRTYAWPVCADIFQVHYPDDVSYDALFGEGNMCIK